MSLYVAVRSAVVNESRGYSENCFGCHWLCQCSLRDVDKRFSTGRASGTQNETDQPFLKVLVAFRSEAVNESRGYSENCFGCHWLCQCSLRDVDKRFSTGRASGTQNETDKPFL